VVERGAVFVGIGEAPRHEIAGSVREGFLWRILTCEGIKAETPIVEAASSIWQEEKLNVDA